MLAVELFWSKPCLELRNSHLNNTPGLATETGMRCLGHRGVPWGEDSGEQQHLWFEMAYHSRLIHALNVAFPSIHLLGESVSPGLPL